MFYQQFALPAIAQQPGGAYIHTYPLPSVYHQSKAFQIEADGVTVPVVDYNPKYDYAEFSMPALQTVITITLPGGTPVNSYRISPRKLNISAVKKGNRLQLTLQKGEYLIVQVNQLKELVIAADWRRERYPGSRRQGRL